MNLSRYYDLTGAQRTTCIRKVFNALVEAGILSNKGKRNVTVIGRKLQSILGGKIILFNSREFVQEVAEALPCVSETAETRNAAKALMAESITIDLGL